MIIEDLATLISNWTRTDTPVIDQDIDYLLRSKASRDFDSNPSGKHAVNLVEIAEEYKQGYDFEGLEKMENYSEFFSNKGMHYVNGFLERVNALDDLKAFRIKSNMHYLSKAYKEAQEFE